MGGVADSERGAPARLLRRVSAWRGLRRRRPPRLRTAADGPNPTIYYLCPDYQVPSGGIRAMYRHVDILNRAGLSAAVLHHSDGFACRWFEHSTRTVGAPSVVLSREDVLVVPEIYGPFLGRLPRVPRLVAFSQNAYLTFEHLPVGETPPYEMFDAALTVSSDSAEYLRFAFPGLDVAIVPNAIDPAVFHPLDGMPAKRLALMPRKRPDDADQILRLLGDRLRGWEVMSIVGASESETAATLRSAPIFLALGRQEGFGLPAAEAMASGAYVVGFPAFGGRELFDPSCSKPVEDGDVLSAAKALAEAMELFGRRPEAIRELGARAAQRVRLEYAPARQAETLLSFFAGLGLSPRLRNPSDASDAHAFRRTYPE
jgi:glycosyltransferase involved in cell wall biosynthesis